MRALHRREKSSSVEHWFKAHTKSIELFFVRLAITTALLRFYLARFGWIRQQFVPLWFPIHFKQMQLFQIYSSCVRRSPKWKKKSPFEHKFEFNFFLVFDFFACSLLWCSFVVFCRCTIRENLRTNYQLPSGINTLKVPNNLQRYIDLMDWIRKAMWCVNALNGWMVAKRRVESKTERWRTEQSIAEKNI